MNFTHSKLLILNYPLGGFFYAFPYHKIRHVFYIYSILRLYITHKSVRLCILHKESPKFVEKFSVKTVDFWAN